jgi:intein-encoded DNA endonuclease-like protein
MHPNWRSQIAIKVDSKNFVTQLIKYSTFKQMKTVSAKQRFINGLYDSDGSVALNKRNRRTVTLYTSNQKLLHFSRRLLREFGIKTFIYSRQRDTRKKEYSLIIASNESIKLFHKNFKFSIKRKQEKLNHILEVIESNQGGKQSDRRKQQTSNSRDSPIQSKT